MNIFDEFISSLQKEDIKSRLNGAVICLKQLNPKAIKILEIEDSIDNIKKELYRIENHFDLSGEVMKIVNEKKNKE